MSLVVLFDHIADTNSLLQDAGMTYPYLTLIHTHRSIAELLVLNHCQRAQGAGHQHGDCQGCLKGTRESVLNEIEHWTEDFGKSPIFWLNGLAGTGKSSIAQTVSENVCQWLPRGFILLLKRL